MQLREGFAAVIWLVMASVTLVILSPLILLYLR